MPEPHVRYDAIWRRIKLDAYAREILHNVLQCQVSRSGLQMIGQSVVGAAEIETFIFDPRTEVPLPGDQKPVIIAEVIIERITISKFGFLEIAVEGVGRFVVKKIA